MSTKFCTFYLGDRLYGVSVLDVQEINTETKVTKIHHASKEIMGYVNLRGRIHLIIDPMVLLDLPRSEPPSKQHLLLFKASVGEAFGIMVDQVGDIVEVDENDIQDRRKNLAPPTTENDRRINRDISGGVCLMDDELMIILNSQALNI